jgi:hypothetical protein
MAGTAIVPDANLHFVTINAATLSTTEIGAIFVIVSTTIAVTTTAPPPTERQNATVVKARLVMGIITNPNM